MIARRKLIYALTHILIIGLALIPQIALAGSDKESLKDKENPQLIGQRDINNNQINFYSIDKEMALGQQLAAEVERELKILDDPVINEYINRVGQNIVLHSDAKVPFTIKVAISDELNAFALPGGHFYVNTGLILAADNESELAGVMAHEIAHVTARHAVENFSKSQLLSFATIPLIFVGGPAATIGQIGANFGLPLAFFKFSRGAEKEADILGAQYTWASGYDPTGLLTMFEKLQAKKEKEPNAFSKLFLTHPPTSDRIEVTRDLIGRFPERTDYVVNTSEFQQVKERLARLQGAARRLGTGSQPNDRPTLKRLPSSEEPPPEEKSDVQEEPTLRRRHP